MSIISRLASSLNRRDEAPNQELAGQIVAFDDKETIKELIEGLSNKSKDIQSDCIKVLYEVAEARPELLTGYADEFIALLDNKNNRLQWGAMTALDAITHQNPEVIYKSLARIISAADKGSVITNDHCIGILIKLASHKEFEGDAISLLLERLISAPANQLPMYAERSLPVITQKNKAAFGRILTSRLPDIEKESKKARVEKVLKRLQRK